MSIGSRITSILGDVFVDTNNNPQKSCARQFVAAKDLIETDCIIVDMLNSAGHENVAYCVCDPSLPDNPIIFASDGFCALTGYAFDEIQGRNCRFLQGPETSKEQVDRIRTCIRNQIEESVNLLNYRKDGTSFVNEFFVKPLRDHQKHVQYFLGVQCQVPRKGPGQAPANPGWVYSQGNHI